MALLAEQVVEEWLNRQGFFTIRSAKVGINDVDLLAVRITPQGTQCRHVEVNASINPVGYLTPPKSAQRRTLEELCRAVTNWVAKKYDHPKKQELRQALAPGPWSRELVVHRMNYPEERALIAQSGVTIIDLKDVLAALLNGKSLLNGAIGTDLLHLISLGGTTG